MKILAFVLLVLAQVGLKLNDLVLDYETFYECHVGELGWVRRAQPVSESRIIVTEELAGNLRTL